MPYAEAAGRGSHYGNSQEPKYYNEKMISCNSNGISYEKLIDALHSERKLRHISAVQKVDFRILFALVVEDSTVRETLVEAGINVDGIHLNFGYHKRRELIKVYVANIPCGIPLVDIKRVFASYGTIREVKPIINVFHGCRLDTGDRCIIFEKITKPIESYVLVRGWRAYVKYRGQIRTCRNCGLTGHLFANCPSRKSQQQNRSIPEESKVTPESPVNMDDDYVPEPDPTPEEINSISKVQEMDPETSQSEDNVSEDSLDGEDTFSIRSPPGLVSTQDVQTISEERQPWGDVMDDKEDNIVQTKSYCPQCEVDSHSVEECLFAVTKQNNKTKNPDSEDSKPGKVRIRKEVNFKRFKSDLEQIVVDGKTTDWLQYVMEMENSSKFYVLYLLSVFGDFDEAHSTPGLYMAGNSEVMEFWAKSLW